MNVLFSSRCFLRCAGTTVGAGKPSRRATSRLIPAPSNTRRENALFKFCRRAQRQRASTRVRQENATRMAVLLSRVFRRRDGKNRQNQNCERRAPRLSLPCNHATYCTRSRRSLLPASASTPRQIGARVATDTSHRGSLPKGYLANDRHYRSTSSRPHVSIYTKIVP